MSACKCSERKRPTKHQLAPGANERPRQWFVLRRNYSQSAFNGYQKQWSDYSEICCRVCGSHWRTKSSVVRSLENSEFFPGRVEPKVEPFDG